MNGNPLFVSLVATLSLLGCIAIGDASTVPSDEGGKPVSVGGTAWAWEAPGLTPDSPAVREALRRLDERIVRYPRDYEAMLLQALIHYEARQPDSALATLEKVVKQAPNFHLAQMIRGDILLSRLGKVRGIGHTPLLHAMPDSRYVLVEDLRDEANARLRAYHAAQRNQGKLPAELLRLGESVETAILVDKWNHRLYLYANTGSDSPPRLLYDFYVSTGRARGDKRVQGDLRTPEGVYFVTRYTPESQLPDRYGVAAFPINYPNLLDRYRHKTGSGIWLHGIARRFYSRPPLDSEGCVVLTNSDLEQIVPLITPRSTPVVIAERPEWLEPGVWRARREELMGVLQSWAADWESGDAQRYLANYAADFWADGHDLDDWARMKRQQLLHDGTPTLVIRDLSLLAYAHSAELAHEIVVADFRMEYSAGGRRGELKKRLYLRKDGERWFVLHESREGAQGTTLAATGRLPGS